MLVRLLPVAVPGDEVLLPVGLLMSSMVGRIIVEVMLLLVLAVRLLGLMLRMLSMMFGLVLGLMLRVLGMMLGLMLGLMLGVLGMLGLMPTLVVAMHLLVSLDTVSPLGGPGPVGLGRRGFGRIVAGSGLGLLCGFGLGLHGPVVEV